jgi:ferredoxin
MLIIKQDKREEFLAKLKEKFDILDLRNSTDPLPFKKYFFPNKEKILPIPKPPKKFIVFGLDKIDLEALDQLDEIMSKPKEDFYYWQRRKQAIIVGASDKKSKEFVEEYKDYLEEREEVVTDWSKSMREILLDSETLANAVEWSHDHKIWDELAGQCLGCGICTYVCPLCYCFSMEDTVGLDNKCVRCRKWDACTLPNFSKIAGGYNFRKTLKERYYNWFYHKFVRGYNEFGKSLCVGCGRCKELCPAKIDIQEVLKTILEDYGKSLQASKG